MYATAVVAWVQVSDGGTGKCGTESIIASQQITWTDIYGPYPSSMNKCSKSRICGRNLTWLRRSIEDIRSRQG